MPFNRDDLLALIAVILLFAILSVPGDWVQALETWVKSLINLPQRPPSPGWFPTDKVVHVMLFMATALPVTLAITARVRQQGQDKALKPDSAGSLNANAARSHAEKRRLRIDQVGTTAFILMLILGILSEWIQSYIPGRSADPLDLLADVLGSVLGIALAQLLPLSKQKYLHR